MEKMVGVFAIMEKLNEQRVTRKAIVEIRNKIGMFFLKYKYAVVLYLITFLINIFWCTFFPYPYGMDEHGVLANAAYLSGKYNWSACYSSSLPYYWGYGLSVLYVPLFRLFDDVDFIYKSCLCMNSILVSFIPIFAYQISIKVIKNADQKLCFGAALCIGCYPFFTTISKWTLNDIALVFIHWLIAFLLVELLSEHEYIKKIFFMYVFLGFLAVYAYAIHGRGLAILTGTIFITIIISFLKKEKIILCFSFVPTIAITWVIDSKIKKLIMENLIQVPLEETGNTAQNVLKYIDPSNFDLQSIISIAKGAWGQVFYAMTSTIGLGTLFIILFIYIVFVIKQNIYKRIYTTGYKMLCWYALLTFLLAFGISVGFIMNTYATGAAPSWEYYIYGRYIETIYPMCLFVVFLFVVSKVPIKKSQYLASLFIFLFIITVTLLKVVPEIEMRKDLGFGYGSVTSILGFAGKEIGTHQVGLKNFLLLSVISLVILMISYLLLLKKRRMTFFVLLAVCFTYLSSFAIKNYMLPSNNGRYKWITELRESVKDVYSLSDEYSEVYLSSIVQRPIYMQYALPKLNMHYITPEVDQYQKLSSMKKNSFIFSYKDEKFEQFIDNCYKLEDKQSPYVWVYGEELKDKVKNLGISIESGKSTKQTCSSEDIDSISFAEDSGMTTLSMEENQYCIYRDLYPGTYLLKIQGTFGDNVDLEVSYHDAQYKFETKDIQSSANEKIVKFSSPGIFQDCKISVFFSNTASDIMVDLVEIEFHPMKFDANEVGNIIKSPIIVPVNDYQLGYRTRYSDDSIGAMGEIWISEGGFACVKDISLSKGVYDIELEGYGLSDTKIEIETKNDVSWEIEELKSYNEQNKTRVFLENDLSNAQIRVVNNSDEIAHYQGMKIYFVER